MKKKTTLNKLFNQKSCYGWAYECKGKRHYYCWQNDNDLGLLACMDECTYPETIQRRIKVAKRRYVYILRNKCGVDESFMAPAVTEAQLVAAIRKCHEKCNDGYTLTKHDEMLAKRVFDR